MGRMTEILEANGARIAYDTAGSGEPVVLIHAGVANRRMWDDQVTALKDGYRVIRYDTRGFGESETDAVEFSNRADIAALLDQVGEKAAHLVGLSRGGQIALDFALEYPDRARSVSIAAGGVSGYDAPEEADPTIFEEPEAAWKARDWAAVSEWETRYWVDGPGQPADRVDPAIRARVQDWILTTYEAEKEEGTPRPLDPPANARLGDLRAPFLVMIGTLDDPGTRGNMRYLAETVSARLEVFEGVAHMINLEQPQRFNQVLRQFLDEVSGR